MPFVLADLGTIVFAIAVLLFALAVDWFVVHANSAVPTTSFPIVGDIFGWAHDWLNDLHNWVVDAEDAANHTVRDAIVDTGWLLSRIAGAAEQATTNLLNLTRHVGNTLIADAINTAEGFAQDVANEAESLVHNQLVASDASIEATFGTIDHDISNIIDVTIPDQINNLHSIVDGELANDAAALQNNINTLAGNVATDIAQVWGQVNPLFAYVYDTLSPQVTAEAAQEQSDIAATQALAHSQLVASVNNIEATLGEVNSELGIQGLALDTANASIASLDTTSATYQQDLTQLSGEAATAQGNIDQLQNQADTLGTQLGAAQGQINTLEQTAAITIPAIPGLALPGSIIVPAAVAGLATVVADISLEIGECMVSVCDGPNNISNLLQTILGGIDLAAMAVFLGEAIKNPAGTAGTFASAGESLYDDADSFIDSLLSI